MEQVKIAPKSEWINLSLPQLYDTKTQMTNRFYDMKDINASFANQYQEFISLLASLISLREAEALVEREEGLDQG
jgi:hypothetical protein